MVTLRQIVSETINTKIKDKLPLQEAHRKGARVLLDDGREVDFGHPAHLEDLKKTLAGLERLKGAYDLGTGTRMIFAQAARKIKDVLLKFSEKQELPSV